MNNRNTLRNEELTGSLRMNIRMSKRRRMLQSGSARTNWTDMVKMLFRTDPDGGRKDEMLKLLRLQANSMEGTLSAFNFSSDEMQYLLFLMLVISIAEKRTQDLYVKDFADRCDSISTSYGLKDDEYWADGKAPSEWQELNEEFEKQSLQILVETLAEYQQDEIAALINARGLEEFFVIVRTIRAQFLRTLKISSQSFEEGSY